MNIRSALFKAKADISALDADLLLAYVLQKPRSYLYAHGEQLLTATEQAQFQALLQRREQGEPIAYIIGEQEFWSLPLRVTQDVLIPRPETELIVEFILAQLPKDKPQSIIDLGTGSGAIAIAIASERLNWKITATDKSPSALAVAKHNAEKFTLSHISFIESDWFMNIPSQQFSAIISNPPYIANDDPHLRDLCYEPTSALVAENNGLDDIEKIVEQAKNYLQSSGLLAIEHGYKQLEAVQAIYRAAGYQDISTLNDLANHPRVTIGYLP